MKGMMGPPTGRRALHRLPYLDRRRSQPGGRRPPGSSAPRGAGAVFALHCKALMMMLYLLSAGTAFIIAALVILLLLLRAVGLLERIAAAIERQNRGDDVRPAPLGDGPGREPPTAAPPVS